MACNRSDDKGNVLVVHTYREERQNGEKEELILIMSARDANQRERRVYLQQAIV
jgi:uncharacterized DUF497 family protein